MQSQIILRPRITEKATALATNEGRSAVYTFEVANDANKATVACEVKMLYKVTPVSVRMVRLPAKKIATRQGVGYKKSVKKALVTLKKGEKIETL